MLHSLSSCKWILSTSHMLQTYSKMLLSYSQETIVEATYLQAKMSLSMCPTIAAKMSSEQILKQMSCVQASYMLNSDRKLEMSSYTHLLTANFPSTMLELLNFCLSIWMTNCFLDRHWLSRTCTSSMHLALHFNVLLRWTRWSCLTLLLCQ